MPRTFTTVIECFFFEKFHPSKHLFVILLKYGKLQISDVPYFEMYCMKDARETSNRFKFFFRDPFYTYEAFNGFFWVGRMQRTSNYTG